MTRLLLLAAFATILPTAVADHPARSAKGPPANIVKTAAAAGQFKTLVSLLVAADLDDALKGDGAFVVFAPTDDAFAKLPPGTVEDLLKPDNKAKLAALLKYHVIPKKERFNYEHLEAGSPQEFKTLNGAAVTLSRGDGSIKVNDATVVGAERELLERHGAGDRPRAHPARGEEEHHPGGGGEGRHVSRRYWRRSRRRNWPTC